MRAEALKAWYPWYVQNLKAWYVQNWWEGGGSTNRPLGLSWEMNWKYSYQQNEENCLNQTNNLNQDIVLSTMWRTNHNILSFKTESARGGSPRFKYTYFKKDK